MQLLYIKIILDLHPLKSKVCAIELFYSKLLSCFLSHCSHSNLTLGFDTSCRELTRNSQTYEKQNRENTCQRKIITCTRQYLLDSAICLRPWSCKDFTIIREKIQSVVVLFLSLLKLLAKVSAPWTKPQKISH